MKPFLPIAASEALAASPGGVGVSVRPARPDRPDVVALLAQLDDYLASLFPPSANHILDVQALLAPEVCFLVAEEAASGQLVGCGAYRRMPGEPETANAAYGEVKRMMVAPAARGRGVGRLLLTALEHRMQADGLGLALLETGDLQHEAVRMYERAGYVRRGPFGGYPDNGLSLFFAKALAEPGPVNAAPSP
ncbi:MAG: GNAT family N-acetyltransferase [Rubrivivax sp.]